MAQDILFSVEMENTLILKLGQNVSLCSIYKKAHTEQAHTQYSAVNRFKMFIIIAS